METIKSFKELKKARESVKGAVAFVPTMGALHAGHIKLVDEAYKYAPNVIVSIFVNPTQFGAGEDLDKYPRTLEADATKLAGFNGIIYAPTADDIYPNGQGITVKAGKAAKGLCGEFRPGHFDGVATVVSKLFDQVQPDFALFGEKDFQQLMVIKEMNYPDVEIIGVPTLREADGLAMSSRNIYLSAEERKLAPLIYNELQTKNPELATRNLEAAGFKIQYLEQRWGRLLVAAYLGNTRLIDNIALK